MSIDEIAAPNSLQASVEGDLHSKKKREPKDKLSVLEQTQRKTELIQRRHIMDTGQYPSELTVRLSENESTMLNSHRYPVISQE